MIKTVYRSRGIHITYTDDVTKRMEAYNWQVIEIDATTIAQLWLIETAQTIQRATVIICNTTIGFGSPNKAGSHDCHGAPLGEDEVTLTKEPWVYLQKLFMYGRVSNLLPSVRRRWKQWKPNG